MQCAACFRLARELGSVVWEFVFLWWIVGSVECEVGDCVPRWVVGSGKCKVGNRFPGREVSKRCFAGKRNLRQMVVFFKRVY